MKAAPFLVSLGVLCLPAMSYAASSPIGHGERDVENISPFADAYQMHPAIAFNGTNYLTVWEGSSSSTAYASIFGIVENRIGESLTDAALPFGAEVASVPAVSSDGTNFCVIYTSGSGLVGRTVSSSGVTGVSFSIYNRYHLSPALSWTGERYLAVWSDYRDSTGDIEYNYISRQHVYGAFVQNNQATVSFPISTSSDEEEMPAIAALNSRSLVAWHDKFLVGWEGGFPLPLSIHGRIVQANGTLENEFMLGSAPTSIGAVNDPRLRPAIAAGPDGWLVVWPRDSGSGSKHDIVGARVLADGTLADATPFVICEEAGEQLNVAVAYSGNSYFVVWQDFRTSGLHQVFGARVPTSGEVLDPGGLPLTAATTDFQRPIVGGSANEYVVITEKQLSGISRLSSTYVSFDFPLIHEIVRNGNQTSVSYIGWPGGNYLLQSKNSVEGAWTDLTEPATATSGVAQFNFPADESSQFYRVELLPPP
jgi:hypothetical protein